MKHTFKRFLAAVLALTAGWACVAAGADYDALLKQAKDYEAKKQYVHALGSYWDAMEAAPEKAAGALDAYNKLAAVIQDGNPGWGEFDEFDLYDGWLALCKDFEQYWTETCPNVFTFSIRKGELDMKTRSATYYVDITVDETRRFKDIARYVLKGLRSKWTEDWENIAEPTANDNFYCANNRKEPLNWPEKSVYWNESGSMKKDGVALVKVYDKYLTKYLASYNTQYSSSVAALWSLGGGWSNRSKSSLYDVKFNITDESGTVLLTSGRKRMGSEGGYELKGVPQATMKIIDAGKARIKPVGVWLEYGKLESDYDNESRDWLKPLPELAVDMSKVEFNLPGEATRDVDARLLWPADMGDFLIMRSEVTENLYDQVTVENKSDRRVSDYPAFVSWRDAIKFCNKLSEMQGLTPCYSVNGTTDTSAWENFFSYSDVKWDKNANGWRLPTSEEWRRAAYDGHKYSGSDNINEVAWHYGNSDNWTHKVATKKPNAWGIYDMTGNLKEWCWDSDGDSDRLVIVRGGSYRDEEERYGALPVSVESQGTCYDKSDSLHPTGIRLVRNADEKSVAEFKRKREEEAKALADEYKNQCVAVDSIMMGKTEVAQDLYEAVTGINPSSDYGEKLPVDSVNWYTAVTFCNRLSVMQGLTPCYSVNDSTDTSTWGTPDRSGAGCYKASDVKCNSAADGWRLPTNEEWLAAANDGNKISGSVWEWCWDSSGRSDESRRVVRSVGNASDSLSAKAGNGGSYDSSESNYYSFGFRVVRNAQ